MREMHSCRSSGGLTGPESGLSGQPCGATERPEQGGSVCATPLTWVPSSHRSLGQVCTSGQSISRDPRAPRQAAVVHPGPWVSHQACVLPVHALRLLHHTGEAAGTGRGAGKVLQHLCSLGCRLRSATDGAPLASVHPQRPAGPCSLAPCPGGPACGTLTASPQLLGPLSAPIATVLPSPSPGFPDKEQPPGLVVSATRLTEETVRHKRVGTQAKVTRRGGRTEITRHHCLSPHNSTFYSRICASC